MVLLIDERKNLHAALTDAIRTTSDLEDLTRLQLGVLLNAITPLATLPKMILEVITYFEQQDRIADLILAAQQTNATNLSLQVFGQAILDRLAAAEAETWYPRPANPFDAYFIEPGPQPFINRKALRQFMQQVSKPNGFPILVVNGLSKTGKSYSFQFIGYLKRQVDHYHLGWVDLCDEVYGDYKPEFLVRDIAVPLGWDLSSMPQRPSSRYPKELAKWMLGQSNRPANPPLPPVVIVLDGFHQPELYGETRELVQELIKQVAANTSKIRLVLLNYADDLLPPGLPPIRKEPLTTLSRPEVVEFFTNIAKQKGHTPDATVIEQIVDQAIGPIPLNDPAYNERLNQRVTEAAQLLLAGE